ncbi:nuclear transport factor 2 family protein [Streptomyces sp. MS06]|uniref:nuclear transport factor 2 family protein n=1 Tax=Streptomyces sp. MS06 TaxID=3385974 RepID=UPI00399FDD23
MNRRRNGAPRKVAVCAAFAVLAALATGCSADIGTSGAEPPARTGTAPALPSPSGSVSAEALGVARGFTAAANAGDLEGIAAYYAADARFDRAGTLFRGRRAIIEDFMATDVVGDAGHYRELSVRAAGERTVVEYLFTSGSGAREHFTYSYRIEGGLIRDVVGRYV